MPALPERIRARVRNAIGNMKQARVRRRRAISSFVGRFLPHFRVALLIIGLLWLLVLPSPRLGRGTYIDENALQPGQVNTYFSWSDVHKADAYLAKVEELRDRNASSSERAEFFKLEFEKLGMHSATQAYNFTTSSEIISGVNAYAVFSAPRASGTEAMVISAPWISRKEDGSLNLRGTAFVLALASHLKRYSHWAKDIIYVICDGQITGMHAWLSAYHSEVQSNLDTDFLSLTSGVIWTALNIDYPGHSFSHLGAFHEGTNGRLPNQDLFNSFELISRYTGQVPVVLYDHLDPRNSDDTSFPPTWLPSIVKSNPELLEFSVRARNIARHLYYQASGKGSGVHALYHRYRIDAFTIFAVPAQGPHGFHTLGKVVESTLRTMNNLLERLHASFFFYILTTPGTFLKIGHYLPSVIMISVSIMFGGLREWVKAGWRPTTTMSSTSKDDKNHGSSQVDEWETRSRPVLDVFLVMLTTHAAGALFFFVSWKGWAFSDGFLKFGLGPMDFIIAASKFLALSNACAWLSSRMSINRSSDAAPPSMVLSALNLCITSTLISVMSLLNFSFAALLCVVLGLPLTILSPSQSDSTRLKNNKHTLLITCAMFLLSNTVTDSTLWNWAVLGVWFAPLMSIVCVPLLLQASIACLAP